MEWKSDNYRIKEPTSIQTGGGVQMQNRLVPYPCVVVKIQEVYLRSEESQSHRKAPPSPISSRFR